METKRMRAMISLAEATGKVNPNVAINALQGVILVRTVSFSQSRVERGPNETVQLANWFHDTALVHPHSAEQRSQFYTGGRAVQTMKNLTVRC